MAELMLPREMFPYDRLLKCFIGNHIEKQKSLISPVLRKEFHSRYKKDPICVHRLT